MRVKYILKYEWMEIAIIEIDKSLAAPVIKQMIEFYEGPTEEKYDDLLWDWLKRLGLFIMRNERAPKGVPDDGRGGDEGWITMDGTHGIKLISVTPYDFGAEDIEIEIAP